MKTSEFIRETVLEKLDSENHEEVHHQIVVGVGTQLSRTQSNSGVVRFTFTHTSAKRTPLVTTG